MHTIVSCDHDVNSESRPLDHGGSAGGLAPYEARSQQTLNSLSSPRLPTDGTSKITLEWANCHVVLLGGETGMGDK